MIGIMRSKTGKMLNHHKTKDTKLMLITIIF